MQEQFIQKVIINNQKQIKQIKVGSQVLLMISKFNKFKGKVFKIDQSKNIYTVLVKNEKFKSIFKVPREEIIEVL